MKQKLAQIALVVKDYDEAIQFYTKVLQFDLIEDTVLSEVKRWVLVRPQGGDSCCLLLAKAKNEVEAASIGNQTGGRVFLFLHTENFDEYYQHLLDNEVTIVRPPVVETWGKVAVFADLYGNMWDLIEPAGNE